MTEMGGLISYNSNRDTIDEKTVDGISSCGVPNNEFVKILLRNNNMIEEPIDDIRGELLVNSKNLFSDYFNSQNSGDFIMYRNERYFCTGDIVEIHNNRIYIIGRKKNILVKNSNKYSPFALDRIISDLKKDNSLLNSHFVSFDNHVVLFQEIDVEKIGKMDLDDIKRKILEKTMKYYNLVLDDIIFISPRDVPKTELGKVKKLELIKKYQEHIYD